MLKRLSIHNLVLVERADLEFNPGLTVITGETGAGKTALLEAIRLILGERADASKVRRDSTKAHITATFDVALSPQLEAIFEDSGVPSPQDEPLVIAREISREGKSRCFVSGEQVTLGFLAKLGHLLVEMIGQHAQIDLKKATIQRDLLDQFASSNLSEFQQCLKRENVLIASLEKDRETQRKLDPLWLRAQVEQLETLAYEPGEEESLFSEFSLLSNSEEIQLHARAAAELADQALASCHELSVHLDKLPLEEAEGLAKETKLQLTEIANLANSLGSKVESDPLKLAKLEERLKTIDQAKKRFGQDLLAAKEHLESQLTDLETIDQRIEEAEAALKAAQEETNHQAQQLTTKRKKAALELSQLLSERLRQLNIEAAEVSISIEPTTRSQAGDDSVTFCLRANRGEKMTPIKDSSSGGELARLLFCLKLILTSKGARTTLVFDEIDAGVGGQTATLMGTQLQELSQTGQILCVTHFPQVAKFATNHLRVLKYEKEGRTHCEMRFLKPEEQEGEFVRMLGGSQMTPAEAL